MKGRIITGRPVLLEDMKEAGLIPGEPEMREYTCRTCGKTCESTSPPANTDHGCSKSWWWLKRVK